MEFDLETSLELTKIIGSIIFDDLSSLLLHMFLGTVIGVLVAYLVYRLIKAKSWHNRSSNISKPKKVLFYLLRITFYLSIIGLSASIGLVIGSNKIVVKEVTKLVDEGVDYVKTNYFEDLDNVQELFSLADIVYSSGYEVNEFNHKIADVVVDQLVKEKKMSFLTGYLAKTQSGEFAKQLEELEKGMLIMGVAYGLKHIGAEELIEDGLLDEERIEKAFYAWLHTDEDASLGSMNEFMTTQICRQIKPLTFSIWLPAILITSLFILTNLIEIGIYYFRRRPQEEDIIDERAQL